MKFKIKIILASAALLVLNACATKTSAFDFALSEDEEIAYHQGGVIVRAWVTFDEKPGNIERRRLGSRFNSEHILAQSDGMRFVQSYARVSVWGIKYANFAAISFSLPNPLKRGDIVDVLLTKEEDLQKMRDGGREVTPTSAVVGLVCRAEDTQCKDKLVEKHGAVHGLLFMKPAELGYSDSIFDYNLGRDLLKP